MFFTRHYKSIDDGHRSLIIHALTLIVALIPGIKYGGPWDHGHVYVRGEIWGIMFFTQLEIRHNTLTAVTLIRPPELSTFTAVNEF